MTSKVLANQVVVVTGASRGIGAATAVWLGRLGAKVVMLARDLEALNKVAQGIHKFGGTAIPYQVDLSNVDQMIAVIDRIENQVGVPNILINNAGAGSWTSILETETKELVQNLAVPGISTCVMTQLLAKKMIDNATKETPAHIINITSPACYGYIPGTSGGYSLSRHMIADFTEHLRIDLRHHEDRLKISLVCPGKVATDYFKRNGNNEQESRVPLQWLIPALQAKDVARKICQIAIRKESVNAVFPFMVKVLVSASKLSPSLMQYFLTHIFGWQPPKKDSKCGRNAAVAAAIGLAFLLVYNQKNYQNLHELGRM